MKNFIEASKILPERLHGALSKINPELACDIQEIRVRANKPLVLVIKGASAFITYNSRISFLLPENAVAVTHEEVEQVFNNACGYSVHSHLKNISRGFVTLKGGHRVGVAGEAIIEDGRISGIKNISSLNIRIAREHKAAADDVIRYIYTGNLKSIIIAGPPLSGKTTMLRDIARQLSGLELSRYYKTVIVDERNEISASDLGIAHTDLGLNTDVLSSYPKGEGILCALRALSPDIILCDEVGFLNEVRAIEEGINSGVKFIVSVHASDKNELLSRPQSKRLILSGAFDKVVLLKNSSNPCCIDRIFEARELEDEIRGSNSFGDIMHSDRELLYKA